MTASSARRPLTWASDRGPKTERPRGTTIELDDYDWWHFSRLGAHSQSLAKTLAAEPKLRHVVFDLYGLLYKPAPVVRSGKSGGLSRAIIEDLRRSGRVEALRPQTRLNEWGTVMALEAFLGPLREAQRQAARLVKNADASPASGAASESSADEAGDTSAGGDGANRVAQRVERAMTSVGGTGALLFAAGQGRRAVHGALDACETAREALEAFDLAHGLGGPPGRGGKLARRLRFGPRSVSAEPPKTPRGVPAHLRQARDQLVQRLRARAKAFEMAKRTLLELEREAEEEIASGEDPFIADACAAACRAAADAATVIAQVSALFEENDSWGRQQGVLRNVPLADLLRLGKILRENRSVREVADLAGRWALTLKRTFPRGSSEHGRTEALGVRFGDDVARLLPSELVLLRQPTLRRVLLARIVERRALQTTLRGPQLLGRGPVIAVVDTSGSMEGSREVLAKALCLALALRCWEKRRPFYVLTFGAKGELQEVSLRSSEDFVARLDRCLGLSFGGGTDFDEPLRRVCELATEKPWSTADAVFITDGYCEASAPVVARLREAKRATDLQVIGALVGGGVGLQSFADVTYAVSGDIAALGPDQLRQVRLLERIAGRL